jgi:hypothetical protein
MESKRLRERAHRNRKLTSDEHCLNQSKNYTAELGKNVLIFSNVDAPRNDRADYLALLIEQFPPK